MEFSSAKIKQLFFEQYNSLSEQDIIDINNKSASGDINNVVVGLNDHCFGVWLMEESPEVNYQLFYVNGKNQLEGDFLQLSLNMPEKEYLTFFFASFLAKASKMVVQEMVREVSEGKVSPRNSIFPFTSRLSSFYC